MKGDDSIDINLDVVKRQYPHLTKLEIFMEYIRTLYMNGEYGYGYIYEYASEVDSFTTQIISEEKDGYDYENIRFYVYSDEGDEILITEKREYYFTDEEDVELYGLENADYDDDYDYVWKERE